MVVIVSYTAMLNFERRSKFNIAIASRWKFGTRSVTFQGPFIGVKPVRKIETASNELWLDGKSHRGREGEYEVIVDNAGVSKLKQKELRKNNKMYFNQTKKYEEYLAGLSSGSSAGLKWQRAMAK